MNSPNKQSGTSVLHGLLAILVVALIAAAGFFVWSHQNQTLNTASTAATSGQPSQNSSSLPASGTSNTNFNSDLNSIGSSLNQENSDQSSTNSAVNDQQSELIVPTT